MMIWILSHNYLFLYHANGDHYKRRRNGRVALGTKLFFTQHRNIVLKSREVIYEKNPEIMEMGREKPEAYCPKIMT